MPPELPLQRTSLSRKRVNDALHGAVFLTATQYRLANTPAFLRLANIKQLGLGAYVYPGAGYSRYEHSIGASHVAGQMIDAMEANAGVVFEPRERELTGIAALLHDVGHYPFSHATEEVVEALEGVGVLEGSTSEPDAQYFSDHEELGQYIIENDEMIAQAIRDAGIEPHDVAIRLKGGDESSLKLILSSDLDCDRLDYLRRTALHAGLPYGGVDASYLIDNLTMDKNRIPCIHSKALGSADHFLISRLYDFEQVPFHKAVVGYEEALKKTLAAMAKGGWVDLTKSNIKSMISNGRWRRFDDQMLVGVIREFRDSLTSAKESESILPYVDAILDRRAPKLIVGIEYMDEVNETSEEAFETLRRHFEDISGRALEEFNINPDHAFIWRRTFRLLKGRESGQRIQILSNGDTSADSWPIEDAERTLCSKLEHHGRRHLRLYACLGDRPDAKDVRDKIRSRIGKLYKERGLDDIFKRSGYPTSSGGLVDAP